MKEYFDKSDKEHKNSDKAKNDASKAGNQQLTNLGLFRIYAESYLKKHPMIDKSQNVIIRHIELQDNGLPLQIYAYSNKNIWIPFENLQSEIIEHLIAILHVFDLKVFQQPTGDDIKTLKNEGTDYYNRR
jgi:miniconductance mechanosensitive channel